MILVLLHKTVIMYNNIHECKKTERRLISVFNLVKLSLLL